MAASMGIKVQPSRFAILKVESESESGEEEGGGVEWMKVPKAVRKKSGGSQKEQGVGPGSGGGGEVTMSKNAKKRARKKRNQQKALSEVPTNHITVLGHMTIPLVFLVVRWRLSSAQWTRGCGRDG